MPIYEYLCKDCEQIVEEWQKDFAVRAATCPVCGGDAQRIISNTSFVLKGTGWYVTDYCNKPNDGANGSNGKAKTDTAGASSSETSGATNASDAGAAPSDSAKSTTVPQKVETKACCAPASV